MLRGDSSMPRVTSVSAMARAERLADLPEGLQPDLAVGVHLGEAGDLAEVPVRVAAGACALGTDARSRRADRAVDRLGPKFAGERDVAHHDVTDGSSCPA